VHRLLSGAGNLMAIRGIIMPVQWNYYGLVDRLRIDHRYRSRELRERDLIHLIERKSNTAISSSNFWPRRWTN
jgi:hypothetical protein